MGKAVGFDTPNWSMDPYPDDEKNRIYVEAFERIYLECVEGLKRDGFGKEHQVSLLNVFDDMVLTGIDYRLHDAMISALHIIYQRRPSLQPLIDEQIDYVARITAEHALEKS